MEENVSSSFCFSPTGKCSSSVFELALTVHGLQSDQAGDEVVKVHRHVVLRVAQDDQLEQLVVQLEAWESAKKHKKVRHKRS